MKNSVDMRVNIMVKGAVYVNGTLEAVHSNGVTIYHKKPRSSKYRRTFIPMQNILSLEGKEGGDGGVLYMGSESAAEYRGVVETSKFEGFVAVTTENGLVNVRADAAEIISVEDYDGPVKKKTSSDGTVKKKKKKKLV